MREHQQFRLAVRRASESPKPSATSSRSRQYRTHAYRMRRSLRPRPASPSPRTASSRSPCHRLCEPSQTAVPYQPPPRQRRFDVFAPRLRAHRHNAPLVQRRVRGRSFRQRGRMPPLQRLQPHVFALKCYRINWHCSLSLRRSPHNRCPKQTRSPSGASINSSRCVMFVCRAMHIALRQFVQLWLQLRIQRIHIAHVVVVAKVSATARSIIWILTSPDTNAAPFALEIRIVARMHVLRKAEQFAKERHRALKLCERYMHERRRLNED